MTSQEGWTISQVEALIGLSRRDIQRCCYEGKGGVGILSPKDSKWGRRTYTADDLARLFIVARMKADGMSLPEARRALDKSRAEGLSDEEMVADFSSRLIEELERIESLALSAQAILHQHDAQALKSLIADHLQKSAHQQTDWQGLVNKLESLNLADLSNELRFFLLQQLDLPGFALAIELWLGPQAVERLRDQLDHTDTPEKPRKG